MIVLMGNQSGPVMRERRQGRENLGQLLGPLGWRTPETSYWACDNDVFAAWKRSLDITKSEQYRQEWAHYWHRGRVGEQRWLQMLDKVQRCSIPPMWVLLPDVVGDWMQTLDRANRYRSEVARRGLRVAIALQDGAERDWSSALALCPDAVFVGGSVPWKWRYADEIVKYFHAASVSVHIGRVCGPRRITRSMEIGADSIDGTGFRFDETRERLFDVLDGKEPQLALW